MSRSAYYKKWREENKDHVKQYTSKYSKAYYQANRQKAIDNSIKWTALNRDKTLHNQLMRKYKITLDQYNEMLVLQNHVCAICRGPEVKVNKFGNLIALAVDHCHKTGKIRGLLCSNCNKGLGFFKDIIYNLYNAIAYLVNTY